MIEREVAELRARVAKLEWALGQLTHHLGIRLPEAPSPSGVSPTVVALVRGGDKMAAIKVYMTETGCDLRRAKEIIDTLE